MVIVKVNAAQFLESKKDVGISVRGFKNGYFEGGLRRYCPRKAILSLM